MRVTTTNPLLARLVAFLNFDFKTGTEESLKTDGLNVHELGHAGWKKRGAKLQEEIRLDLTPLLSDTPTDEMHERDKQIKLRQAWQGKKWGDKKQTELMLNLMTAGPRLYHGPQFYLDRLLEKINQLDLRFRWYAELGQHELKVYDPDFTKSLSKKTGYPEALAGTERKKLNPAMGLLGPERRITTIIGEKFVVARQVSYAKGFRELFYGIIAESLESGSFTRVRMCLECGKFFIAEDLKRKFCSDRCKDQFFNAKKDFKKARHMLREKRVKTARRLLKEGRGLASVMDETGLSQGILRKNGLLD